MIDARLLRMEGLEQAVLAFAVSGRHDKCVDAQDRLLCIESQGRIFRDENYDRIHKLLAEYPQAMEFIELWFLIEAPKFVADQILRHRLASWMVSSARKSQVHIATNNSYGEPIQDLIDRAASIARRMVSECVDRAARREICNRFVPPIIDTRIVLAKMNLREFAHMYCLRKYRGGQTETVELLELMKDEINRACRACSAAVDLFCSYWGYITRYGR